MKTEEQKRKPKDSSEGQTKKKEQKKKAPKKQSVQEKNGSGDTEKKNPLHREYGLFRNVGFVLEKLWRFDRFAVFLIVLGTAVAPFYQYFWTFISKFVIDVITGNGDVPQLVKVMAALALAQVVVTMLKTYVDNGIWWRLIAVRMNVILLLNRKAMTVDFEHLENPDVMDCHQKAQNAVGGNNQGIEGMMHQMCWFLENLTIVAAGLVILSTMNVVLVLFLMAMAGISFAVNNHINKTAKREVWDKLAPWWRKSNYMQDAATNFAAAKDIRMFGLKEWMLSKYRALNTVRYEAQKKNEKLWAAVSVTDGLLWLCCRALIYAWLIYAVLYRQMSIGNFSLYFASSATFFSYVSGLLNQISEFFARSREVDDFRSFLDFEGNAAEEDCVPVPECDGYEFTFENVSFCYPRAEKYALKNLNLTLRAGQRLAVVGLNGAGKTTMIKLLLRLYEPTEGRILLNGVDVRRYKKESYYKVFAPVFQEVEMFAFPLSQNISMQDTKKTDADRAEDCMVRAGLSQKLKELPKGVETQILKVIYDDGIDMSGGEKQKLALSRALYKDAPVVVLDEPTAALDALAESKLYEDFDKLIGGKTAVYISHRLSSTQFCSAVAMFADGEMKEYGTHEELMAKNGAYAELFRVQAQYYIEKQKAQGGESIDRGK